MKKQLLHDISKTNGQGFLLSTQIFLQNMKNYELYRESYNFQVEEHRRSISYYEYWDICYENRLTPKGPAAFPAAVHLLHQRKRIICKAFGTISDIRLKDGRDVVISIEELNRYPIPPEAKRELLHDVSDYNSRGQLIEKQIHLEGECYWQTGVHELPGSWWTRYEHPIDFFEYWRHCFRHGLIPSGPAAIPGALELLEQGMAIIDPASELQYVIPEEKVCCISLHDLKKL